MSNPYSFEIGEKVGIASSLILAEVVGRRMVGDLCQYQVRLIIASEPESKWLTQSEMLRMDPVQGKYSLWPGTVTAGHDDTGDYSIEYTDMPGSSVRVPARNLRHAPRAHVQPSDTPFEA